MLFHTQIFLLLFLPAAWCVWRALRVNIAAREYWVIAASLVFISWWDWRFTPILVGSIIFNWLFGGKIQARHGRPGVRRLMWFGVIANLALLGAFKYLGFAWSILSDLGVQQFAAPSVILPIAISFYTFQQISYLVDCAKGEGGRYPFRKYAFFVSFFPQLIAGPIVRHNELIPQLGHRIAADVRYQRMGQGLILIVIGLIKKVAIADQLAPYADAVFASAGAGAPAAGEAWLGLLSFAFQIYFDFSAYSDMAIGLGLLFGLKLPINFNAPYRAVSMRDFWRRWHITLSRFFRDYLYIPLGGNRHGPARQVAALFLTMALCGLWHGAGWPFVLWGVWHGAGLIANHLWYLLNRPAPKIVGWAITAVFVLLGWVLFRSPDAQTYMNFYRGLFFLEGGATIDATPNHTMLLIAGLIITVSPTSQDLAFRFLPPTRALAAAIGVAAAAVAVFVGEGASQEFIYFQF